MESNIRDNYTGGFLIAKALLSFGFLDVRDLILSKESRRHARSRRLAINRIVWPGAIELSLVIGISWIVRILAVVSRRQPPAR